jgi:hypothetical protein
MLKSSGKIDLSGWTNIHVSEYDHFVNTIQALNKDDGKFRLYIPFKQACNSDPYLEGRGELSSFKTHVVCFDKWF